MSIKGFLSIFIIGITTIGGTASYADSIPATHLYSTNYNATLVSSLYHNAKKSKGTFSCKTGYTLCSDTTGKNGLRCYNNTWSCPDGGTLSGNDGCSANVKCSKPVYSCPSGYSLSGSTCLKIGSTTSPTITPATANVQYAYSWYFLKYKRCPLGGYVQIAPCTKKSCDYSKPVCAKTTYSCPSGYSLQPDKQCKLN